MKVSSLISWQRGRLIASLLFLTQLFTASMVHAQQDSIKISGDNCLSQRDNVITLEVVSHDNIIYTACQMDVVVPEALNLQDVTFVDGGLATSSHIVDYTTLADTKTVRVIAYSNTNANFSAKEGPLFKLLIHPNVKGDFQIEVKDIHFTWSDGKTTLDRVFENVTSTISVSDVTGIEEREVGEVGEERGAVNLAGQRVGKDYKGIIVVNGRKEIRR